MVIQGISKVKALREKQSIKEKSISNGGIVSLNSTDMRSEDIDSIHKTSLAIGLSSSNDKNKSQTVIAQSQAVGIEALTVLPNDAILSSFIDVDKDDANKQCVYKNKQCIKNQQQCIKNQQQCSEKANTVDGLNIKDINTIDETVNANESKLQTVCMQKQTVCMQKQTVCMQKQAEEKVNANESKSQAVYMQNQASDDYLTAILKLFGSDRTIRIDSNIGLVSAEDKTYVTDKKAEKSYDVWDIAEQYKIIDSFNVIGSDGVYLFNEDCIGLGILESDDKIEGYMFILKNYKTKTILDEFLANEFDPDSSKEVSNSIVVKLADNPILYTNDEKLYNDNKKYNTHELDRFIEYIPLYILSFRRYKYVYHPLDNKNNIFILKRTG